MIRAELAKLLSVRGTWIAAVAGIVFSAALVVTALSPANELDAIGPFASYPAFIAGLACAHLLGGEYASGAIASTYAAVPWRERVLGAKALAAALVGLVWGVASAAAMLAVAAPWLAHFDVAWSWSALDTARFVAGVAVITACFAVAGTAAAALARRPGSASGVLGAVYLGASGLLGATTATGAWTDYGIGAAQLAVLEPGAHALGFGAAVAVNAGYALAFLAVGVLVARRVDV